MAVTRGCFGKIYVKTAGATSSTVQLGRLTRWTLNETANEIDSSEMGSCVASAEAGSDKVTMQIDVNWDTSTGNNQDILTIGSKIFTEIYPGGNGSGSDYYKTPTGGATVLQIDRSATIDGLVVASYQLTVNGSMTATSVP